MSKQVQPPALPASPRWIALGMLGLAGTAVSLAFLLGDDAVAGAPEGEAASELTPFVTPAEGDEPWIAPGEVNRLSIPMTPEQQGLDPNLPPQVPTAAPTVIFVNMGGATLGCGGGNDNSTSNTSIIACQYGFSGNYPAYGGTAQQQQAVMDAVKQDWAPFNMSVVSTRPASGNYTMCMTGDANHPFGNGVLGIAPLDCYDYNPNNVVFAFHSANDGFNANTQATTISQEVAHAYGLEHVGNTSDIMNPYNAGGNPSFTDSCIGIQTNGQGIVCGAQHQEHCNAGQQNSYQELLGLFGANDPDDVPPNVIVSYPTDGAVLSAGADFQITCEANDNQGVAYVELFVDGASAGTRNSSPYAWDVVNLPAGSYEAYCVAYDEWDNDAFSPVVSFSAEDEGVPGDGDGDSGTTGDSGGTTDSGGEDGADTADDGADSADSADEVGGDDEVGGGGLPPGFGSGDESGCACSSDDGPARAGLWLLALLGLPLLRRRR